MGPSRTAIGARIVCFRSLNMMSQPMGSHLLSTFKTLKMKQLKGEVGAR
jgi:hypothetical protein